MRKLGLDFPVLVDRHNAYAKELGLTFRLPDALVEAYEELGIDLEEANGDADKELPIPTRLVIAPTGRIVHVDADPDYTHRPEPDETLRALEKLSGEEGAQARS